MLFLSVHVNDYFKYLYDFRYSYSVAFIVISLRKHCHIYFKGILTILELFDICILNALQRIWSELV